MRGRDGKITSWKDPFSMAAATKRQKRYREVAQTKRMWTPQFVVNNTITSNKRVREIPEVVTAAAKASPQVRILADARAKPGTIDVSYRLAALAKDWTPPDGAVIHPVLFRKKVVTKVTGGENQGKTLTEYFVVIDVRPGMKAAAALTKKLGMRFMRPAGVPLADLGVAVLVEDPAGMKTIECVAIPVKE